jgi:hypothetical protein
MSRNKKTKGYTDQQSPEKSGLGAITDPDEPDLLPPETAEDFLHIALKKSDLDGIVQLLRDWYGREKIKEALNKIVHRDPVDQFTQIRRHAIELYAKQHGTTPSRLLLKLEAIPAEESAMRSARERLQKARKFTSKNRNAIIAAGALAKYWGTDIPTGTDPDIHLTNLHRNTNIL